MPVQSPAVRSHLGWAPRRPDAARAAMRCCGRPRATAHAGWECGRCGRQGRPGRARCPSSWSGGPGARPRQRPTRPLPRRVEEYLAVGHRPAGRPRTSARGRASGCAASTTRAPPGHSFRALCRLVLSGGDHAPKRYLCEAIGRVVLAGGIRRPGRVPHSRWGLGSGSGWWRRGRGACRGESLARARARTRALSEGARCIERGERCVPGA